MTAPTQAERCASCGHPMVAHYPRSYAGRVPVCVDCPTGSEEALHAPTVPPKEEP